MEPKVKQVYVNKVANLLKVDHSEYSSSDMVSTNRDVSNSSQVLHYKRLVVPSNMRSIYWKCYGFPANDDNEILTRTKIVCLLCKNTMTYNRNTTNLRMHLQNKHKNELATLELVQPAPSNKKGDADRRSIKRSKRTCTSSSSSKNNSPTSVIQVFPIKDDADTQYFGDGEYMNPLDVIVKEGPSPVNTQPSISAVDGKVIANAIAEFIILDMQNPDIVEGKGFQRLVGTLKSPCEIPSKALLVEELIPKSHDVVKTQVFEEVSTLNTNISLAIEDWLSSSGDIYSTGRENDLQSRLLGTIYCSDVDALHWGAQFDSIMDEYCIKVDKIKAIVLATESDEIQDTLTARGYTVIPCFSHTLQACAKAVFELPTVKELIKKCRAIVSHLLKSPAAMAELRMQETVNQIEEGSISIDNSNSWVSTLMMLESIFARRLIIPAIMNDTLSNYMCPSTSLEITDLEWSAMEDVVSILAPFRVTIATMVEEKNPLVSILKPIISQLMNVHLQTNISDSNLSEELKSTLSALLKIKYKEEKINGILELSSALDPRFKNLPFLTEEERQSVKKKLQSFLKQQGPGMEEEENYDSKSNLSKKRLSGMEFLLGGMCTMKPEMPSSQRAEQELTQYEWESQAALEKSPVEWWKEMNGKCYQLSCLAWSYLSIPACSKSHLNSTLSPNNLLQNIPAQLAVKLKFLNHNYAITE